MPLPQPHSAIEPWHRTSRDSRRRSGTRYDARSGICPLRNARWGRSALTRSAKLARPQTRSERARMQVAICGMVLLVVGVFVAAASKAGVGWAIVAALASAVAFGIPVSVALATQRRNRSLPEATAHPPPPPTEQELPLTPAMTDYAQSPVFRRGVGSVTSLVSFVLVLCFAAPAFISFVMLLQHRPLGAGAAVVWVLFGLLASGLIYAGLRNARLVRRDLAGGVYVRWTGPDR